MSADSEGCSGNRNVVIVMPSGELAGGADLSLLHLLRHSTGVQWHVAFLQDGPMIEMAKATGATCIVVNAGRFRNVVRAVTAIRTIARLARTVRAEAILGWMTKAHLYGGPAALMAGVPAIWFQKGLPSSKAWMEKIAARIPAVGILACSNFVAEAQRTLTPHTPVRAIHSAVEDDRFDPAILGTPSEARRKAGLPDEGPIIGIFGRLQHWKGMHVVIEAMTRIKETYPSARLVIAGARWPLEPEYADALVAQVELLGLGKQVIFTGHLSGDSILTHMQACDVVVHASDREPFGIVILEAMALAKPVVAGSEGGPTEIITEGVDGSFAPFGDAQKLAGAVLGYLDDRPAASAIGHRARLRATQFSARRFACEVSKMIAVWSSVAEKSSPDTSRSSQS
jgi:hypothetical protein